MVRAITRSMTETGIGPLASKPSRSSNRAILVLIFTSYTKLESCLSTFPQGLDQFTRRATECPCPAGTERITGTLYDSLGRNRGVNVGVGRFHLNGRGRNRYVYFEPRYSSLESNHSGRLGITQPFPLDATAQPPWRKRVAHPFRVR